MKALSNGCDERRKHFEMTIFNGITQESERYEYHHGVGWFEAGNYHRSLPVKHIESSIFISAGGSVNPLEELKKISCRVVEPFEPKCEELCFRYEYSSSEKRNVLVMHWTETFEAGECSPQMRYNEAVERKSVLKTAKQRKYKFRGSEPGKIKDTFGDRADSVFLRLWIEEPRLNPRRKKKVHQVPLIVRWSLAEIQGDILDASNEISLLWRQWSKDYIVKLSINDDVLRTKQCLPLQNALATSAKYARARSVDYGDGELELEDADDMFEEAFLAGYKAGLKAGF